MAQATDIGGKRLISLAPGAWVQWATQLPNAAAREIVSAEFQWVSRRNDVLIRATSPKLGDFLALNEIQLRYHRTMPRRIRAYAALAEEKYALPVYPILVNVLPPTSNLPIPSCYCSEFAGLQARQDYRVINLWEVEAELVLQQPLPPLLPFVPILKGGGSETKVRQALQQLQSDENLDGLESLLAFFASFVLGSPLVQQIMRWDMTVLRESPWYQEILQQGLQQGLKDGIALALELKFGEAGLELVPEIRQIEEVETLQAIQSALKTVSSLEALRQVYRLEA